MVKITTGHFQTNTYIVDSKDECIIIDPGYDIEKYLDKINKFKVLAVVLTHNHCDHIDSIGLFDCPIYVHKDDYDGLKNNIDSLYHLLGGKPSFDYNKLNIIKLRDEEELHIGKIVLNVLHTPGHTSGSCCFMYKDVLFTGDTLFKESAGRTDFPSGDHKTLLKSLTKLSKLDPKIKVYPGHGDATTIKDEKKNNLFLRTL